MYIIVIKSRHGIPGRARAARLGSRQAQRHAVGEPRHAQLREASGARGPVVLLRPHIRRGLLTGSCYARPTTAPTMPRSRHTAGRPSTPRAGGETTARAAPRSWRRRRLGGAAAPARAAWSTRPPAPRAPDDFRDSPRARCAAGRPVSPAPSHMPSADHAAHCAAKAPQEASRQLCWPRSHSAVNVPASAARASTASAITRSHGAARKRASTAAWGQQITLRATPRSQRRRRPDDAGELTRAGSVPRRTRPTTAPTAPRARAARPGSRGIQPRAVSEPRCSLLRDADGGGSPAVLLAPRARLGLRIGPRHVHPTTSPTAKRLVYTDGSPGPTRCRSTVLSRNQSEDFSPGLN